MLQITTVTLRSDIRELAGAIKKSHQTPEEAAEESTEARADKMEMK
jgi:hypothetical protein